MASRHEVEADIRALQPSAGRPLRQTAKIALIDGKSASRNASSAVRKNRRPGHAPIRATSAVRTLSDSRPRCPTTAKGTGSLRSPSWCD